MKLKIEIFEGIPTKHSDSNCRRPESNCAPYTFYGAGRVRKTFVKDYKTAAKQFNAAKTIRAISIMREYDLKSKGLNNSSTTHGELLREMIFKIMQ